MLGLHCNPGFALIVASGSYSLLTRCGLLVTVASLVEEHGLGHMGLVAPRHVGSSQIRDQTHSPALAGRFFTAEPPGEPLLVHC